MAFLPEELPDVVVKCIHSCLAVCFGVLYAYSINSRPRDCFVLFLFFGGGVIFWVE